MDIFWMDSPRTLVQAEAADDMGIWFDKVILIDVADGEVIRRISGRRQCSGCGAVYHIDDNPSEKGNLCAKCGGDLITRDDDTEQTVKNPFGSLSFPDRAAHPILPG